MRHVKVLRSIWLCWTIIKDKIVCLKPILGGCYLAATDTHCWCFQSSRRLWLFWGIVHFPPLVFLTAIMSPADYDWQMICVIILFNWIRVLRQQRFVARHSYSVLHLHKAQWRLQNSQGECLHVTLEADSWVQEYALALRFKPQNNQAKALWCIVLPDSLPPGQFKDLCRALTVQAHSC